MVANLPETDKAWIAGFIDGEGYVGITRHRKKANHEQSNSWLYHPWLVLTSTDTRVLEYIQSVISTQKRTFLRRTGARSQDKEAFQVKVTKFSEVVSALGAVLPYLKIKARQARLVIEFCKIRTKAKIIYLKLRKLNKRGSENAK